MLFRSIGGGLNLGMLGDIEISVGGAINLIQSDNLTDRVEVDTLYSDVTNLTTLPDFNVATQLPTANFMTFSTNLKLNSNINLGASWENDANITSSQYYWEIDSTSGLFQHLNDSSFVVSGLNYMKPEIKSLALSFMSDLENMMSIDFELNQISYNGRPNSQDYKQYKFGFEYLTPTRNPIRGGLVYSQAAIPAIKPVPMFTFGPGKTNGNIIIDAAGTYCFQSFSYPDLFPVEGDIRTDYDLVRDSQLNLQLGLTYQF